MTDDLDPLTDDAVDGMYRLVDSLRHHGRQFAPVPVVVDEVAGHVRAMVDFYGFDGTVDRLLAKDTTQERVDVEPIVNAVLAAVPSLPSTLVGIAEALGPSPVPADAQTALYAATTSADTIDWVTDGYWWPSHRDYDAAKEAISALDAFSYAVRAFTIEQRGSVTGKLLAHLLAGQPLERFDVAQAAEPRPRDAVVDAFVDLPPTQDGTPRLGAFYTSTDATAAGMLNICEALRRDADGVFRTAEAKGATVALHLVLLPMVVPPESTEKHDDAVFSKLLRETAIVQAAVAMLGTANFPMLDAIETGKVEVVIVPLGHDAVYRLGTDWLTVAKNACSAVRDAFGSLLPNTETDRGREVLRTMMRFIENSDRCYPDRMGWRDVAKLESWIASASSVLLTHGGDHASAAELAVGRPLTTAITRRDKARALIEQPTSKPRP